MMDSPTFLSVSKASPVGSRRPARASWTPTLFRLVLLALCLLLAEVQRSQGVLAWIAVLLLLTGLTQRHEAMASGHLVMAVEVAFTCVGVSLTHGVSSPLFAYLPAPLLASGLLYGWRFTVVLGGEAAALLMAGRIFGGSSEGTWQRFTAMAAQWVVMSLAVGVLADRIRRQPGRDDVAPDASYEEALALLTQLRNVTRRLPGSLDPVFVAEGLLANCAEVVRFEKAAVLVQTGEERLSPLASRGTQRVPWRHPLTTPGPLQTAWRDGRPTLDVRTPDVSGRRQGSALLAMPIGTGNRVLGLVVLESDFVSAFPPPVIRELNDTVAAHALRLGTAVVFEEFRTYASVAERERLAGEMHDGVGQDLASIGFELDDLQHKLVAHPAAQAQAKRLRQRVTEMVRDIRLSISELKSGEMLSRGLGAALTSHVRAAGAGGGFAVHLSLAESTFRLPADTEVELLRITQEVTAAARRRHAADNVWVTLHVDPPAALLRLEHDGSDLDAFPASVDLLEQRVSRVGGRLAVGRRHPAGVSLEITIAPQAPG